ncbi:Ras family GTPase [uncultured virus]|nr:Ras family GTPase [uncultured virus]
MDDSIHIGTGGRPQVTLIGAPGVGKTSLLGRFHGGALFPFREPYRPTMPGCFTAQGVVEGKEVDAVVWDLSGTECMDAPLSQFLYGDTTVAVMIADAARLQSTLKAAARCKSDFDAWSLVNEGYVPPAVLFVNKSDRIAEVAALSDFAANAVQREMLRAHVREHGYEFCHLVSAKTGEGVQEAFRAAIQVGVLAHAKRIAGPKTDGSGGVADVVDSSSTM